MTNTIVIFGISCSWNSFKLGLGHPCDSLISPHLFDKAQTLQGGCTIMVCIILVRTRIATCNKQFWYIQDCTILVCTRIRIEVVKLDLCQDGHLPRGPLDVECNKHTRQDVHISIYLDRIMAHWPIDHPPYIFPDPPPLPPVYLPALSVSLLGEWLFFTL